MRVKLALFLIEKNILKPYLLDRTFVEAPHYISIVFHLTFRLSFFDDICGFLSLVLPRKMKASGLEGLHLQGKPFPGAMPQMRTI